MHAPLCRLLALATLALCSASDARAALTQSKAPAPTPPQASVETGELALPPDWAALERVDFESGLELWTRGDKPLRVANADLVTLRTALSGADERAVRAALILARSRNVRAFEALLERLEERKTIEAGKSDAADVVAAAALNGASGIADLAPRLEVLSVGKRAHPELSVRVECARSALDLGRDTAITFLLDVLREGTHRAQRKPDFKRPPWTPEGLDWIQARAADALSRRAKLPLRFRPEATLTAREAEIERLESVLLPASQSKK
jgi:hypothetical protein